MSVDPYCPAGSFPGCALHGFTLTKKGRPARADEVDLNQRENPFGARCIGCRMRDSRNPSGQENMQIVVSQQEVERTKSAAPPFARRVLVVAGLAVWKLSDVQVAQP